MSGSRERRDTRRALAFARALCRSAAAEPTCVSHVMALMEEDDSVARAKGLLADGGLWALTRRGEDDLERLELAYRDALDFSVPAAGAFAELDAALEAVQSSCASSRDGSAAPAGSADLMTAGDRRVLEALERDFISAVCYVVATLYGPAPLDALVGLSVSSAEDARRAEAVVDAILEGVAATEELGCWTITCCQEGGSALPATRGYVFDWSSASLGALDRTHGLRRVAPFLSAGRASGSGVVLAGKGNVVGTDPLDSVRLRDAGVVTTLAPSALVGGEFDLADPVGSLRAALGGDAFCLAPDDLAHALDRRSHALGGRRRA